MRISITQQREIVKLIATRTLTNRNIAQRLKLHHSTVGTVRTKLEQSGLDPLQLCDLDDTNFARQLDSTLKVGKSDRILPDWENVKTQLQTRDVTLALVWEEYRLAYSNELDNTLSYPQFTRRYRVWQKKQRISMRQTHRPGDKFFVDFCGKTMSITKPDTGVISFAQVFVGVLGASGYTFAYAVPSQKIPDWVECHVKAFEFFGGVPQQIVTDNLKSAVIKNTTKEVFLNRAYADMGEHYDVIINPARPRKPKDKSLAEVSVQIVQRWVLAPLRNRVFFSIDELNVEIMRRITFLNNKTSKTYLKSRHEQFVSLDQPALMPLPVQRFELAEWKCNQRVPHDYHIFHGDSYYSVPFQYRQELVDVRSTQHTIEIFRGNKRIASHLLRTTAGQSTKQEHMPIEHLRFSEDEPALLKEWAETIGSKFKEWVTKALEQRNNFANGWRNVKKLRQWVREEQNHDRLESAAAFALTINVLTFERMQSIIRNKSDLRQPIENTNWVTQHSNLRGADYYSGQGAASC